MKEMFALGKKGLWALVVILLAGSYALPIMSCQREFTPAVGRPAVNFSGQDLEGNRISLSDYRNNIVLLIFWTTWCSGCLEELPYTNRLYNAYEKDGFRVVGINLNADRSDLEAFLNMIRLDWPQIYDGTEEIAALYRVGPLPATFLLDRKGIIRYTNLEGKAELEHAVRDLLGLPNKASPDRNAGELQHPSSPLSSGDM